MPTQQKAFRPAWHQAAIHHGCARRHPPSPCVHRTVRQVAGPRLAMPCSRHAQAGLGSLWTTRCTLGLQAEAASGESPSMATTYITPTSPGVGCRAGVNTASQVCEAGHREAVHRHGCYWGGCAHHPAAAASSVPVTSLGRTAAVVLTCMSLRVAVVLRMPLLMIASALQPDTRASRKVQALHTDQQLHKCVGRCVTLGCEVPQV